MGHKDDVECMQVEQTMRSCLGVMYKDGKSGKDRLEKDATTFLCRNCKKYVDGCEMSM